MSILTEMCIRDSLHLIQIASALGTAEVINLTSLLAVAEERESHEFILLDDAVDVYKRQVEFFSGFRLMSPCCTALLMYKSV